MPIAACKKNIKLTFPENFYWGTATAAFQIEGHPEEYLAKLSDWSHWIDREDKVLKPTNEGRAVNHYEHLLEDIDLIRGLNSNSYRFSFNWARLHRGPGEFDQNTAEFYKHLLENLYHGETHVEPFATIVHFTLPSWLAKEGGWENPKTAYAFEEFTEFLVKNFGSYINFWITHNEPNIFLGFGYESGIWPPGYENDFNRYLKAYQGMLLGHQLAYRVIKTHDASNQVGFSQNLYSFEPFDSLNNSKAPWQSDDAMPNIIRKQLHNYMFIESCAEMEALDFLGVNYYTRFSYKLNPQAKDPANPQLDSLLWGELQNLENKTNDLSWEIYPQGLYKVLSDKKLRRLLGNKPIFITENGYSRIERDNEKDIDDDERIEFIRRHLIAVHKAISEGVNIQGYFYWSLLDNFEWALGMDPRFGLVHVDHESFKRTPKKSYHYYSKIAAKNQLVLN